MTVNLIGYKSILISSFLVAVRKDKEFSSLSFLDATKNEDCFTLVFEWCQLFNSLLSIGENVKFMRYGVVIYLCFNLECTVFENVKSLHYSSKRKPCRAQNVIV